MGPVSFFFGNLILFLLNFIFNHKQSLNLRLIFNSLLGYISIRFLYGWENRNHPSKIVMSFSSRYHKIAETANPKKGWPHSKFKVKFTPSFDQNSFYFFQAFHQLENGLLTMSIHCLFFIFFEIKKFQVFFLFF
jgi:hypothetical protein